MILPRLAGSCYIEPMTTTHKTTAAIVKAARVAGWPEANLVFPEKPR